MDGRYPVLPAVMSIMCCVLSWQKSKNFCAKGMSEVTQTRSIKHLVESKIETETQR